MTDKKLLKHYYGWRADTLDKRDKLFAKVMKPIKLPPNVDLRPNCSPIFDQSDLGSCTANAIVGAIEFLEKKDKIPTFEPLSRLFLYYQERYIENTVCSDSGAEIRDGVKSLVKYGICGENCWPYDISKFTDRPPDPCYEEGKTHCCTSYFRILNLNEMKICLASGFPFIYGFSVYESMETEEVAESGIVPMPQPDEQLLGGHAVMAVGYNDKDQRFLVRNSWGTDWGQNGYYTMPYQYLIDRDLSEDFWTIRKEAGF